MDPLKVKEVPTDKVGKVVPQPVSAVQHPLSQAPSSNLTCLGDMSHRGLGPQVASSLPEECLTAQVGHGDRVPTLKYVLGSVPAVPQNSCL